jgi:tryptophan synthase alpha chain
MSDRISDSFQMAREEGRAAFVAYVCAGDPDRQGCIEVLRALVRAGVDVIELGVPFSDPLADGAVNQAAAGRALAAGMSVEGVLEIVRSFREESQVPLVLFTYLNPVYTYGYERFHQDAASAGADGLLLLDLPPDEIPANRELANAHGLLHIQLVAPTTPGGRLEMIAGHAQGFLYYVSRAGVTGEQASLAEDLEAQVRRVRAVSPVPVAVGFGISSAEQAAEVARHADGVVVGSAIVRLVGEHGGGEGLGKRVEGLVRPLVEACRRAGS